MSELAELGSHARSGTREQAAGGRRSRTLLSAVGLLAALATSSCCLLPFVLFTLGISGAWIGNLTALAPYQPVFFMLAVALLGTGFHRVYASRKQPSASPTPPAPTRARTASRKPSCGAPRSW
jgi:mercuric ion transport protein